MSVPYDWLCVRLRASVCARLSVCACVCHPGHMLSPPSSVYRGTGANRAAWLGSTTMSRRLPANPVMRRASPVQVRAEVKDMMEMYVCIHLKGHCHILTPHKRSHALAQLKTNWTGAHKKVLGVEQVLYSSEPGQLEALC